MKRKAMLGVAVAVSALAGASAAAFEPVPAWDSGLVVAGRPFVVELYSPTLSDGPQMYLALTAIDCRAAVFAHGRRVGSLIQPTVLDSHGSPYVIAFSVPRGTVGKHFGWSCGYFGRWGEQTVDKIRPAVRPMRTIFATDRL